jgi:thiamine monophosphate kinase
MSEHRLLQIYGQRGPHDEVAIVGNPVGLRALRDAINNALDKMQDVTEVMIADGEHYELAVTLQCEDWQDDAWQGLALPYSDGAYQRGGTKRLPPFPTEEP